MTKRIAYLKKSIAQFSQKLDAKGFVANHDGNITIKIENGFLATPTSQAKAAITEELVITLDEAGKKTAGIGKPFSEISLHLAAYNARPEINAVIQFVPGLLARGHGIVDNNLGRYSVFLHLF